MSKVTFDDLRAEIERLRGIIITARHYVGEDMTSTAYAALCGNGLDDGIADDLKAADMLRRERDEARAENRRLRDEIDSWVQTRDEARRDHLAAVVRAEEAEAEVSALESALDEQRARRKAAEAERDAAHRRAEQAELAAEDARLQLRTNMDTLNRSADRWRARAEQAERERDEARAALARLREVAGVAVRDWPQWECDGDCRPGVGEHTGDCMRAYLALAGLRSALGATPADLAAELVREARVEGARLMHEAALDAARRWQGRCSDAGLGALRDLDPVEVVRHD